MAGSVISTVAGGLLGNKGAKDAANAQRDAAAQAMAIQQAQLDFVKDSTIFNRATGQNALAKVADLFGVQRPSDSTVGIEQDLNYTAGRPLPATPAQLAAQGNVVQSFSPTQQVQGVGAQGAPIGGAQQAAYNNLFGAGDLQEARNNRSSNPAQALAFAVGRVARNPEMLNAVASGDFSPINQLYAPSNPNADFQFEKSLGQYLNDNRSDVQKLFQDINSGKLTTDDFYAGKFGQPVVPPTQAVQAPAPINAPLNQTQTLSPLDAYNQQLNSSNTATQTAAQPTTQAGLQQTIASLFNGQGTVGNGQNSDPIRSQLATALLNDVANSQLNQDNILSGNVTNSLPALFDISRGEQKTTQDFIRNNFETDPGYQFIQDENERAIRRNLNAKGQLGSGELFTELMKFNTGLAQQSYGDYANRTENALGNLRNQALGQYNSDRNYASNARQNMINDLLRLSNVGGEATQLVNQAGTNAANDMAQTAASSGTAQASGIIGGNNAIVDAINQGATSIFGGNQSGNNNFSLSGLFGGNKPVSLTPSTGFNLSNLFGGGSGVGAVNTNTISPQYGDLLGGVY